MIGQYARLKPAIFAAIMLPPCASNGVAAAAYQREEGACYTLMISTGITFGRISMLCGPSHGVISQAQCSHSVATPIASVAIPTMFDDASDA